MTPDTAKIIKQQVAKLRADLADRIYSISEPANNGARRIDEEAHALALPANEPNEREERSYE
jgi:hypothetical protein